MVEESMQYISAYDPEIAKVLSLELDRQRNNLELIASENLVSQEVMAVMGSVLTNKYAEGYPGRRFYGGGDDVGRAGARLPGCARPTAAAPGSDAPASGRSTGRTGRRRGLARTWECRGKRSWSRFRQTCPGSHRG